MKGDKMILHSTRLPFVRFRTLIREMKDDIFTDDICSKELALRFLEKYLIIIKNLNLKYIKIIYLFKYFYKKEINITHKY